MSSMQRPAIVSFTLLTVAAILSTVMSSAPAAQAIAAGAPYADKAYCDALPALVTKFEGTVLPKQARDLAEQSARLDEAEGGRAEASQEFNQALLKGIADLAKDQLGTAKALRERVRAMKTLKGSAKDGVVNTKGMLSTDRREWLERIKKIEDMGERLKTASAGADYAQLLKANQADLTSFLKFMDDSGVADMALKGLADTLAPGVGGLVVNGIKVGLDVVYAGLKGRFTAQEAAQWRDNVGKLKSAHDALKDRVDGYRQELTSGSCGPKVAQQVQNSPRPIPPQEAAPQPDATTSPKSGNGVGTAVKASVGIAGAAVGGIYLKKELDKLKTDVATTTTTTTTPPPTGGSNTASTVTSFNITCTLAGPGTFRNCTGSLTATVGPSVTAGVALTATLNPALIVGRMTPPNTGSGQSLTFAFATSGTAACPGTQSSVTFLRSGTAFSTATSRSITITCN